jgi:hypothetical protein
VAAAAVATAVMTTAEAEAEAGGGSSFDVGSSDDYGSDDGDGKGKGNGNFFRKRIECRGGVLVGVVGVKVKLVNGKIRFALKERKTMASPRLQKLSLESTFLSTRVNLNEHKR